MIEGVLWATKIAFSDPFLRAFNVDLYPKTAFPLFITSASFELTLSVCCFFPIKIKDLINKTLNIYIDKYIHIIQSMDSNPFDNSKDTKDNLNSNNRYMDSKQQIQMLAQEIAKEIVDKETMEKYGTSLNETMTHDYVKTLEKKYYELKRQFDTIDANSNSELTFDEVYDFFKDKTLPNSTDKIDRKYIERLFFLMDKDKNNRISIQEFVFAYIKLEEKLSLKRKKLINLLNELKDSKKQYEDKRKKTEDEKLNKDGIWTI